MILHNMQPPTAPTTALSTRAELMAVMATVDELIVCTCPFSAPPSISRFNFHGSSIALPKRMRLTTPAQVTALNAGIPDSSRHCWVVYIGREPSIYYTMCVPRPLSPSLLNPFWPSKEADHQIKGCPG
ncbi:hypothetical protein B0H14DRAFT_3501670 [Mycena olivaceomarginata]|nr:hypothetical protein B0H14DRAFT_3501670 [Mycena olivaceomarginata]